MSALRRCDRRAPRAREREEYPFPAKAGLQVKFLLEAHNLSFELRAVLVQRGLFLFLLLPAFVRHILYAE